MPLKVSDFSFAAGFSCFDGCMSMSFVEILVVGVLIHNVEKEKQRTEHGCSFRQLVSIEI